MKKIERLRHRLRWSSISNLYKRLWWKVLRSFFRVNPEPFIFLAEESMSGNMVFNDAMPWGRYHPNLPWQYHSPMSVEVIENGFKLGIFPYIGSVYHEGHTEYPELDVGCIHSEEEYLYGEFELECTLPEKGQWASFWLLGDDGWPPEIDIFEFIPKENCLDRKRELTTTIHYDDIHYSNGSAIRIPNQEGRQYFGLKWTPNYMEFFYNGMSYLRLDDPKLIQKYFSKPMRIIIGTGVAGYDYDEGIFDSPFLVHDVRYKKL